MDLADLARRTLADLDQEAVALDAALETARRVRAALRAGDPDALATELQHQPDAPPDERGRRRWQLRQEWAGVLGTSPEAVTLTAVAGRLPAEEAGRLTRLQERLRGLAAEADELNRGNAAMAGQCRNFLREVLGGIAGGHGGGCYSPRGSQLGTVFDPLIEARG